MPVTAADAAAVLRERARVDASLATARAERLREVAKRAAQRLRAAGAREVWLFGSIAEDRATPTSDLDLAVWGLPPEAHIAALADLMADAASPVDLIRLEEAPASLRDRVHATGQLL